MHVAAGHNTGLRSCSFAKAPRRRLAGALRPEWDIKSGVCRQKSRIGSLAAGVGDSVIRWRGLHLPALACSHIVSTETPTCCVMPIESSRVFMRGGKDTKTGLMGKATRAIDLILVSSGPGGDGGLMTRGGAQSTHRVGKRIWRFAAV